MTFEEKLNRLSQIVNIIEKNQATLEELAVLYKEATDIIASCNKSLSETQLSVLEITKDFTLEENGER